MTQPQTPWHSPGRWYVTPHYWEPELAAQLAIRPSRVQVKDVTLREGEDQTGVIFTHEQRVEIAVELQALGIQEIELPRALPVEEHRQLVKDLRDAGVSVVFSQVAPGMVWERELAIALDQGAESITYLFRMPKPGIFNLPGQPTLDEVRKTATAAIKAAKSAGLRVAFGTPHAARARLEDVLDVHASAIDAGADLSVIYDSLGIGLPLGTGYLVKRVVETIAPVPVLYHCHNDLGLATANTLAAVEAGATWVDVSINGLGDRAGNASLEEVALVLEIAGVDTGLRLEALTGLSRKVEEASGVALQPHKAVVGTNAFREESAAHLLMARAAERAGAPEDPVAYVPRIVGQRHETVIGSSSFYGDLVAELLTDWRLSASQEQLAELREITLARMGPRGYLDEQTFKNLCVDYLSNTTSEGN